MSLVVVGCDEMIVSLDGSLGSREGDVGAFKLAARFDEEDDAEVVDDETRGVLSDPLAAFGKPFEELRDSLFETRDLSAAGAST